MANNASTIKRIRQGIVRHDRNKSRLSTLRTAVKQVRLASAEGNLEVAQESLVNAVTLLDRAAQSGVIHRNAAARSKSRLVRLVSSIESAA